MTTHPAILFPTTTPAWARRIVEWAIANQLLSDAEYYDLDESNTDFDDLQLDDALLYEMYDECQADVWASRAFAELRYRPVSHDEFINLMATYALRAAIYAR